MNRQPFQKPPRWWSPKLSPWWVWFWRPRRKRIQLKKQRLVEIDVRGLEHLREAVARGQGVLITPNHASHADCYALYAAADQLGCPVYVMIAWQNFTRDGLLMDALERAIFWRPRPDRALQERIYRFAEGILSLKELECFGRSCSGPVPGRIRALIDAILAPMQNRYGVDLAGLTVPERVKGLRQRAIERMEGAAEPSDQRKQCEDDLDDLFLVVQLFSYPGDYVLQQATVERIAETLDKFEEDVLGAKTAAVRGARTATVTFGEPIPVEAGRGKKGAAAILTRTLEERVQALLDELQGTAAQPVADSQVG